MKFDDLFETTDVWKELEGVSDLFKKSFAAAEPAAKINLWLTLAASEIIAETAKELEAQPLAELIVRVETITKVTAASLEYRMMNGFLDALEKVLNKE